MKNLKRYIKDDNTVCTFVDITKLGLVELTRKKVHKSLKQILEKTLERIDGSNANTGVCRTVRYKFATFATP